MRVLQHNIKPLRGGIRFVDPTVREMKIDVAIIADPYIRLNTQACVSSGPATTVRSKISRTPSIVVL